MWSPAGIIFFDVCNGISNSKVKTSEALILTGFPVFVAINQDSRCTRNFFAFALQKSALAYKQEGQK